MNASHAIFTIGQLAKSDDAKCRSLSKRGPAYHRPRIVATAAMTSKRRIAITTTSTNGVVCTLQCLRKDACGTLRPTRDVKIMPPVARKQVGEEFIPTHCDWCPKQFVKRNRCYRSTRCGCVELTIHGPKHTLVRFAKG